MWIFGADRFRRLHHVLVVVSLCVLGLGLGLGVVLCVVAHPPQVLNDECVRFRCGFDTQSALVVVVPASQKPPGVWLSLSVDSGGVTINVSQYITGYAYIKGEFILSRVVSEHTGRAFAGFGFFVDCI